MTANRPDRPDARPDRPRARPGRPRHLGARPDTTCPGPRPGRGASLARRRTRPLRSAAAGLAVVALALAGGCAGGAEGAADDASGDLRDVTVVLDWTPNTNHLGLYVAQERGYFTDAGLDVTIVEPGEASGLSLLATGQADFAYSVAEALVPARAKGADVVSIAAVTEHNTSSLVSLTETGITRPRDLAGRSYGSYGGALEEALVRRLVACDGGDPDAVEMVPLVSDDFRVGLTQRQLDVAWVFEGWDTIRLRDVDGLDVSSLRFEDYTGCIPDWYTPLVATSGAAIADDPGTVAAFVGALAHGYRDAIAQPQAAADTLLAAVPELDRELVERSAAYLAGELAGEGAPWGRQDPLVWEAFVAFLESEGLTPEGFDTAAAWTDEFLD